MSNYLVSALAFVLLIAGCAAPVKMVTQESSKGDNVVCILYEDSRFKEAIIEGLKEAISEKGYEVIAERRKNSKYLDSSDYGAVVSVIV